MTKITGNLAIRRMYQSRSVLLDSKPPQGLMVFGEVLDTVLHLSEKEWRTLTKDMTDQYTKLNFASFCTEIVVSVSECVVGKMLPDLIERFGIESVIHAELELKTEVKRAVLGSSGQRLAEMSSDVVCNSIKMVIIKIKAAMQEAILSVASEKKSNPVSFEVNKSVIYISPGSDVKPKRDDSAQSLKDMLIKRFSHILTSDTKEVIEIVVSGLVSAAKKHEGHARPSRTSISSPKPPLHLQASALAVSEAQKKPSKLLTDIDRCTEEVMCQIVKLYLEQEQKAKSIFHKHPQPKKKLFMISNVGMEFKESGFVTTRCDLFLDKASLAIRTILLQKSVSDLIDKPVTTLYHSGPFRSQFALQRGAIDSAGSVVMALDQFYESMQSRLFNLPNRSDALASFASDAVNVGKERSSKSPRSTVKEVRRHIQKFLSKVHSEVVIENEDDLALERCTEEILNKAVYLCRKEMPDPASVAELSILTSSKFWSKLSHLVTEIIQQKLLTCPSLKTKQHVVQGHLKDISLAISRIVSSALQQFVCSQLVFTSDSSPFTLAAEPRNLFSPLCLFIKVQKKLKKFFYLFVDNADLTVSDLYQLGRNKVLFTEENLAPRDLAHSLSSLTAELLLEARRYERTCSSDSFSQTPGTKVHTVAAIPCHSDLLYTFAQNAVKSLLYVLKPSPDRFHQTGSNQGASYRTSKVMLSSDAEYKVKKVTGKQISVGRSAGRPSSESQDSMNFFDTLEFKESLELLESLKSLDSMELLESLEFLELSESQEYPSTSSQKKEESFASDATLKTPYTVIQPKTGHHTNTQTSFDTSSTEEEVCESSGCLPTAPRFCFDFYRRLSRMLSRIFRAFNSCFLLRLVDSLHL